MALIHPVAPNACRGGSWMSVKDHPIPGRARATPPYRSSVGILAERLSTKGSIRVPFYAVAG
jgi:hypothetical protein